MIEPQFATSPEPTSHEKANTAIKLRALSRQSQQIVLNVHRFMQEELKQGGSTIPYKQVLQRTATAVGMTRQTVSKYVRSGIKETPDKRRKSKGRFSQIDDMTADIVRDTVYSFYRENKAPTVAEVLEKVKNRTEGTANEFPYSESTLRCLLKDIGFKFVVNQGNRIILMESFRIQCWRSEYLSKIHKARDVDMRNVVYLDETWFNAGDAKRKIWSDGTKKATLNNPVGKGERLIIVGAGGPQGWVTDSLLALRTRKGGSADYHKDMDAHNFEKWFAEQLLPNLQEPTTIVMDNASYHSRKSEKLPPKSSTKAVIAQWLDSHGIEHGDVKSTLKSDLLKMAKQNFTGDRYYVEEMAEKAGHEILRLPPYHCIFNPIEQIWSILKPRVRDRNSDYKASTCQALIEECAKEITSELWQKECEHVKVEEKRFGDVALMVDNAIDSIIIKDSNVFDMDYDSSDDSDDSI